MSGRIFGMLPIAKHRTVADAFETPHGVCFEGLAKMFEIEYRKVWSVREAMKCVRNLDSFQHCVIEVEVNSTHTENALLHKQLRGEIGSILQTCALPNGKGLA